MCLFQKDINSSKVGTHNGWNMYEKKTHIYLPGNDRLPADALRNNNATLQRQNNDVIISSCVRWELIS